MARRQLLTDEERNALLGIPTGPDAMVRRFTLSQADQELVAGRRGDANRLVLCAIGPSRPGKNLAPHRPRPRNPNGHQG